jgi:hypothetical protein
MKLTELYFIPTVTSPPGFTPYLLKEVSQTKAWIEENNLQLSRYSLSESNTRANISKAT